jgi:hypothetical protein
VDSHGINVHNWEVCHGEIRITVLSRCPDTFDQIVYVDFEVLTGIKCCVVFCKSSNISEEHVTYIFSVEEQTKQRNQQEATCYLLHAGFLLLQS